MVGKKKSGFLEALDHLWNHHLSQLKNTLCIICGSSASWMIKKIINGKSGFHMRLTHKMHLKPFTILESTEFLKPLELNHEQILSYYLVFGGVAKYLISLKKSLSVSENIQGIIFSDNGILNNEFDNLFRSLFDKPNDYIKVVKALCAHHYGLTREEIVKKAKLTSGCLFCIKWIENLKTFDSDHWIKVQRQQKYSVWFGYSFETFCIKHLELIKQKLGISGVHISASFWKNENAQIDLLLEREDRCIHVVEMKYSQNEDLNLSKIASEFKIKNREFRKNTKTCYQLINTIVTNYEPELSSALKDTIHKVVQI